MSPALVPLLRRRRRARPEVPARADVLALASLLLAYPDDDLLAARPALADAARALPASSAASSLVRFTEWFGGLDRATAQGTYVETFDLRRRSSLYLTYYLHGDTRRRGGALVVVKQRYRAAGFVPDDGELADYLPTALEFAARTGPEDGEAVLRAHRVGLEIIRRTLTETASPYADVLDAVCVVVGDLAPTAADDAETLMRSGPPDELVGTDLTGTELDLDPYAATPHGGLDGPLGPACGTKET